MIDISLISRTRKTLIRIAVAAVAFFGILAVISLVLSSGALKKPMHYQKAVPDIQLNPGERKVFEFESFCLDNSRGSPGAGHQHSLMGTPAVELRPYLREIFDEYLSHPSRWKQSDVQQAVWYTEGHKKWETVTPEQQKLIRAATGQDDPVSGHPVIILGRMTSAFGTVVKTNLFLALLAFGLVVLTLPVPAVFIERGISWMISPRLAQKFFRGRFAQGLNAIAENKDLISTRIHLDILFTRLVFRVFSRRR
jgi:hypothetical protein